VHMARDSRKYCGNLDEMCVSGFRRAEDPSVRIVRGLSRGEAEPPQASHVILACYRDSRNLQSGLFDTFCHIISIKSCNYDYFLKYFLDFSFRLAYILEL
jgi:hypothetical protein